MSKRDAAWRTQNVGTALASASMMFERAVLRILRDGEFDWVGQVHLALFRNLDLDGTRLTELAARARVTKQSMQELVDKAEAFGVVERRASPLDGRVKIVAFTPAGLAMLEQFRKGVTEAERDMAETLGGEVVAELKARLRAYVEAAELFSASRSGDPAVKTSRAPLPHCARGSGTPR